MAVDGNLATKWFDASIVRRGFSLLVVQVEGDVPLASYALFTANDNPKRDPIAWKVHQQQVSGGAWIPVSEVSLRSAPPDRQASYRRESARMVDCPAGSARVHCAF